MIERNKHWTKDEQPAEWAANNNNMTFKLHSSYKHVYNVYIDEYMVIVGPDAPERLGAYCQTPMV